MDEMRSSVQVPTGPFDLPFIRKGEAPDDAWTEKGYAPLLDMASLSGHVPQRHIALRATARMRGSKGKVMVYHSAKKV